MSPDLLTPAGDDTPSTIADTADRVAVMAVWLVADLPTFEHEEQARVDNAEHDEWGHSVGWSRPPYWAAVARASVAEVRRRSAWTHDEWLARGDQLFPDLADQWAFGWLWDGVSVSHTTWYDGRHRALAQIDAGAHEIVVCQVGA